MPALAIYIDAPMQSWGTSSKYQYRETGSFPTKSALVGILAAASGIDKHAPDEAEKLAHLTALRLTVAKIPKCGAVVTRLMDFHTIGGGYEDTASGKLHVPPVAEKTNAGALRWKVPEKRTVVTRRSYLTDASFIAIFEGSTEVLEKLCAALLDPVWGIWFGRKNCLPASPLTPTIGDDRQAAFRAILEALPNQEKAELEAFEFQEELAPSDTTPDGTFYQSDQPLAFGQHYGPIPASYLNRGILHHRPQSQ